MNTDNSRSVIGGFLLIPCNGKINCITKKERRRLDSSDALFFAYSVVFGTKIIHPHIEANLRISSQRTLKRRARQPLGLRLAPFFSSLKKNKKENIKIFSLMC